MSLKGELKIGGFLVDLAEETRIALNFIASDVRDPGKVKSDFSYTIDIPGTAANHQTFNHLFDTNIVTISGSGEQFNPDFNPNKRAEAVYSVETIQQFVGYAQLKKVNNLRDQNITYELVLFGETNDFFLANKDKDLSELDLSRFDHVYNKTNQANSWATSIKENGADVYFDYGNGYLYPMIDYGFGTDEKTFKVEWMFPAVYAKTVWDQIFQEAGFSYDSDFINSEFFKHLIIPFHSDSLKLTDAQVEDRLFRATNTTTDEYLTTEGAWQGTDVEIVFDNDSTAGNFDNGNNYNNANGKYRTNDKGKWNFKASIKCGFRFQPAADNTALDTDLTVVISIGTIGGAGFKVLANKIVRFKDDGDIVDIGEIDSRVLEVQVSNHETWNLDDIYILAKYVRSPGKNNFATGSGDIYFRIESTSIFYNEVVNDGIKEGDTVSVSQVLPDWTCAEFITQMCKAFNLVIEPDRQNSKTLIVEPFNDFYSESVLYWSDKVDRSFPIQSDLIPFTERGFTYTYSQDSDYWNEAYFRNHGRVFGDRNIETGSDFGKDVKMFELAFGATPMVGSKVHDRVIPHIYKIDDQLQVSRKAVKPRLLYYAGMVDTAYTWIHQSNADGDTSYDSFPYAGTLTSIAAPTRDLNFGQPRELFYTGAKITNQTLYNVYHKGFVDEIVDRDSRLVTLYLRIKPVDILNLSFRRPIHIDGTLYRLNKISAYDPSSDESTQIELIKIKVARTVSPLTANVAGGANAILVDEGDSNNNEDAPTYYVREQPNGNYFNPRRGQYVTGRNNYVDDDSENVIVNGDNNRVMNGASGVTVTGDDNEVTESQQGSGNYYDVSGYTSEAITTLHSPLNSDGRRCYAQLEAAKWANSKSCEVIFKGQAAGANAGMQVKIGNSTISGGDVIIGFPSAAQGNATTNPGTGVIEDFVFSLHFTRVDDNTQHVTAMARINSLTGDNRFGTPYGRSFYMGEDLTVEDVLIFLSVIPATGADVVLVDSIEVIYNQ